MLHGLKYQIQPTPGSSPVLLLNINSLSSCHLKGVCQVPGKSQSLATYERTWFTSRLTPGWGLARGWSRMQTPTAAQAPGSGEEPAGVGLQHSQPGFNFY